LEKNLWVEDLKVGSHAWELMLLGASIDIDQTVSEEDF